MSHLADTNIVTRWVTKLDPQHKTAVDAVVQIWSAGQEIYITAQNLLEFRYQATRPIGSNGLGLDAAQANIELARIQAFFPLAPETPYVFAEWKKINDSRALRGSKVYDARLIAVMRVHGLTHILTFNSNDFKDYPDITVVDPSKM
jgi:predicted nucleic acid-binding protein